MGRKRKKVEESSGGGSWLTTYSDLVTLLLCFFILLYSMAIIDMQKFEKVSLSMRAAFSGAGAEAFDIKSGDTVLSLTPFNNGQDITDQPDDGTLDQGDGDGKTGDEGSESGKGDATGNIGDEGNDIGDGDNTGKGDDTGDNTGKGDNTGDNGDMTGGQGDDGPGSINAFKVDLQGLIDKMGLNENIKVIDEGSLVILRMDSVILFDTGSADLKASARPVVEKIGKILETLDTDIHVQGHADDRPINTREFPSNWELSTKRATNVVKFLIEKCDIDQKHLTATGNAEFKPIVPNDSEYNRQKNRRIDIAIYK